MQSPLTKLLQCSTCLQEMTAGVRIFHCSSSHAMCGSCRDNPAVATCSVCQVPVTETTVTRNLLAERMAAEEAEARGSAEVGRDYILLSSNGKAVESQGHMLGLYVQTGSHSGKPFYKQLHTVNTSFERLGQAEM